MRRCGKEREKAKNTEDKMEDQKLRKQERGGSVVSIKKLRFCVKFAGREREREKYSQGRVAEISA